MPSIFSPNIAYVIVVLKILVSLGLSSRQNYLDLVGQESFLKTAPPACMGSFPNHI